MAPKARLSWALAVVPFICLESSPPLSDEVALSWPKTKPSHPYNAGASVNESDVSFTRRMEPVVPFVRASSLLAKHPFPNDVPVVFVYPLSQG